MKPPRIHAPTTTEPALKIRANLANSLRERIMDGASFAPGHIIHLGWMCFKILPDQTGELVVHAPRAGTLPMAFIPDCSLALNLILEQHHICDSFELDVELAPCNARQSALVIKDFAACREPFMNRTDPVKENASGWFFGATDSKLSPQRPENLEWKSLWELSNLVPAAAPFFLLPPGWQVSFKDKPTVLKDYKPASPVRGSYYDCKYRAARCPRSRVKAGSAGAVRS